MHLLKPIVLALFCWLGFSALAQTNDVIPEKVAALHEQQKQQSTEQLEAQCHSDIAIILADATTIRDELNKFTTYAFGRRDLQSEVRANVYVWDSGTVHIDLVAEYVGDDWIFMNGICFLPDTKDVFRLPDDKIRHEVATGGKVRECGRIDISKDNDPIERLIQPAQVTVRFQGEHGHADKQLGEEEKQSIKAAILVSKHFKQNLSSDDRAQVHDLAMAFQ